MLEKNTLTLIFLLVFYEHKLVPKLRPNGHGLLLDLRFGALEGRAQQVKRQVRGDEPRRAGRALQERRKVVLLQPRRPGPVWDSVGLVRVTSVQNKSDELLHPCGS